MFVVPPPRLDAVPPDHVCNINTASCPFAASFISISFCLFRDTSLLGVFVGYKCLRL
jgi:hypothetical protein